ncbi:enoyl-CoA hydratase/isomerase family protein [Rhodopirellula sallentina]|uniref:Enoyl-CoA hydratase/isomerase n=1 Tax=Rhodopirellula sallentina SM41 TaxID=1263870 RepID=M5TYD7_9BACT|nr:enoyl-CoA hydratase/isomerase family protein [Rhodopirellula sallentina]EMI54217.1 enoyl-CoA hydratase/isomerase [Rhodopirellula sallentina SM41]
MIASLQDSPHLRVFDMQHLALQTDGPLATLTIERPEKHGALSPRLIADLHEGLDELHQNQHVRAVILASSGSTFCSGVDLSVLQEIRSLPEQDQLQQWFEYWRRFSELCETFLRFPKPLIAAVGGPAIGAGFAVALSCDVIVASDDATFSAGAVRHGLVGGITAALLSFRAGTSLSARMSLTGNALTANAANDAGLLCQPPVDSNQLIQTAQKWATESTHGSPQAIQATKRLINESIGETMLTQLAAAAADSATACTTESAGEGIEAFLNKAAPPWQNT